MRVAIYLRCAHANETRFLAQRNKCVAYGQEHAHEVVGIYEDFAQGGYGLDRPGSHKLLQDARARMFSAVVVIDFARLRRDIKTIVRVEEILKDCHVTVIG